MVAVDKRLRDNGDVRLTNDPGMFARQIVESADDQWLRALVDELDREIRTRPLERLQVLWDLSNAGAARLFGVSRQAYSKWLDNGPPADRVDDVAAVGTVTDLLDRYVRRDRIPAVVRRNAPKLGGKSLLALVENGELELARQAAIEMFDLRRTQP